MIVIMDMNTNWLSSEILGVNAKYNLISYCSDNQCFQWNGRWSDSDPIWETIDEEEKYYYHDRKED